MIDPVRPLVVLAAAEALAALGVLVAVLVAMVSGSDDVLGGAGTGAALVEIAVWVLIVIGLALIWLGLYRRRSAARTPFVLAQAFVLVLVPLFWGSDLFVYRIVAVLLGVAALGGLALALRPAVRQSLT